MNKRKVGEDRRHQVLDSGIGASTNYTEHKHRLGQNETLTCHTTFAANTGGLESKAAIVLWSALLVTPISELPQHSLGIFVACCSNNQQSVVMNQKARRYLFSSLPAKRLRRGFTHFVTWLARCETQTGGQVWT